MSADNGCGCGRVDAAKYPWDRCIRDQLKRGYSKSSAENICGYIKKKYGTELVPDGAHLEAALALGIGNPSIPKCHTCGAEMAFDEAMGEHVCAACKKKKMSSAVTCSQGLCLSAGTDDKPTVWNVVAYEGEWKGHPMGAFQFTRQTFEQIIANFRADPRYARRAGMTPVQSASAEEVGTGVYDVIQWDFHHAAEMPAASVAAAGAPSQGWVVELTLGEHEGKSALMALTRWLEPARTYIRTERYKYCSVSVWLDATDPMTGKSIGAVLTSIAITNNPFLQGLPPLKASRDAQEQHMSTNATGGQSAKDATVQPAAIGTLVAGPDLRYSLARLIAKRRNCSVEDVSDGHILAAMEGADALQAKIDELMAGIGAKTLAEALAKMQAAEELKSKLQEAISGQQAAESALKEYESGMVEEDVGMALASLGITDESKAGKIKRALLAERGNTAESIAAFRKEYGVEALRKEARAKLCAAAGEIASQRLADASTAHLTASVATQRQTPPAVPPQQPVLNAQLVNGRIVLNMPSSQEPPPGAGGDRLTLSALRRDYPGEPNDFARKVAYVRASHAKNNPQSKPLDNDTACERAHLLRLAD